MIRIIYGHERHNYPEIIDSMHRLRKQVFHDRLKWEVPTKGEWEIDSFDDEDPLYVLCLDEDERLQGSLRLLPTTGPNMLKDVFGAIVDNIGMVSNPFVWESSRFCVRMPGGMDQRQSKLISKVTVELIAGMGEVGVLAGLEHIVTVYDATLRRIIRQTGCNEELIGSPVRYGRIMTFAGLFEINPIEVEAFKRAWNLPEIIVESESRSKLIAA